MLVYSKKKENWNRNLLDRTEQQLAIYANPDNDQRGKWASDNYVSNKSRLERPNSWYPITRPSDGKEIWPAPTAVWRYSRDQHERNVHDDKVWWGSAGLNEVPRFKRFLSDVQTGVVPQTLWLHDEVGHNQGAKQFLKMIFSDKEDVFQTPKPLELLLRIIQIAANSSSIVLDSFAGSGTTAHAVLEANRRDGGNRRFILVEMEDYADRLTAERVRRVIKGYDFTGTQKTELLREKLNWRALEKAEDIRHRVEAIENLHRHEYERIRKEVTGSELVVTGERAVAEHAPGLGGDFTYCELGAPVELDRILKGDTLPGFSALGTVLFHMATARVAAEAEFRPDDFYLGRNGEEMLWLLYKPDLAWLQSAEAALTLGFAQQLHRRHPEARHIVFAAARHASRRVLEQKGLKVEFAPLPFALYRVERG